MGIGLLVGGAVFGAVWVAVKIGHRLAGVSTVTTDPFAVLVGVLRGKVPWPRESTYVLIAGGLTLILSGCLVLWVLARRRKKSTRVDRASRFMGVGRDIEPITAAHVAQTAARLHVTESPGLPIGVTIAGGQLLLASWEDTQCDIWGPRTGKTTSRAIPAVLEAPGSVLATSNKRDLVDATRDVRADSGPVWVFDPQGIASEEPRWWWNPLGYVTDEVKAAKMAEHFAAGSRAPGAKTDAFFDGAAQDLLAGLLLAASLSDRPITDVYSWLTRPNNDEAVDVLYRHGFDLTADTVAGVITAPDRQRGGVFGTAQQMATCLTNRQVAHWVTPGGSARAEFNAQDFARTPGGTLYSLSKEGRGTAGPLVTALTVAVAEAAEELANRSPGGRLRVPLVVPLDEAANVCRWLELPNIYSHYGSRGILLMTFLQSWSQGVGVWGESGMRTLWSASNIKVYGGGVDEKEFLEHLAAVIGDYDKRSASVSYGRGYRQYSQQLRRERILDVADLAALPKGRAIVFASGARPTLIRTIPWMTGSHADAVRASIAAHDPKASATLTQSAADLAEVERHELMIAAGDR